MDKKNPQNPQKNPLQNPGQKTNPASMPRQEPYNPNKANPSQKKPGSNW
jgi:hypothetical protein